MQGFLPAFCGFFSRFLCAEGGYDVTDAILVHFHHVKADKQLSPRKAFKIAGDLFVALALMVLHRFGGGAVQFGKPRFYLAKHVRFPVLGNDIRLPEGRFVIFGEQFVALPFQVLCRPPFSRPAESFFVNVLR